MNEARNEWQLYKHPCGNVMMMDCCWLEHCAVIELCLLSCKGGLNLYDWSEYYLVFDVQ
jgi:hypothetical protein